MRSSYFDFFDELLLEVRGEGGRSTAQFREMYSRFQTGVPGAEPDIVIERTTTEPDPDVVLGHPDDHYGWTGDQFVIRRDSEFMLVEPGWERIYVSPDWEPFYAIYPVEFALRSRMVANDEALIHASGIDVDGQTTLFPAWRGAGKTNTLLSVLRAGGSFLADDRLWVGADGDVRGYPLAVNLQPHNFESFPEIEPRYEDLRDRVQSEASQYIDEEFATGSSIFEKGARFLNAKFLKGDGRSFVSIDSLFPGSVYLERASVDNFVFLRAAPTADSVTVEPISTETALSDLRSVNYYEWNSRLEEYFHAYDALVPEDSVLDRLHYVVDREEQILTELLRATDAYVAAVPRETDWGETGTDSEVVEAIRACSDQQAVEVPTDD
jgi:hypothetical protein